MDEITLLVLQRRATPDLEQELRRWRRESPAHEERYRELEALWSLSGLHSESGADPPPHPSTRSCMGTLCDDGGRKVASTDPAGGPRHSRRRELFSEGHRLNDMLRHDIPFPTGTNHKGQTYGPVTCVPLPDQETQNNPNV